MSVKERKRLEVLSMVKVGKLCLALAALALGLSYRQAKRIWRRYKKQGDVGLVHGLRGRSNGRGLKRRAEVLQRYREQYSDFGPTLAAEYLTKEGLRIDHETLRRLLSKEGDWQVRRRRQKHRQWRERKGSAGEMVQMDGSHHDWFEGRRARAVLMVMVDDATGWTWARFDEEETTEACYEVFEQWACRRGLPLSLYVDRDSIHRTRREPTIAEQLADKEPVTQFGRAMERLGVQIIAAWSPQAKGRVERCNGTLQDRLVKAMRLAGIKDLDAANRFLEETFLPEFNERFAIAAADGRDVHRKAPRNLSEVLCWEEERRVRKDWTVSWQNRWFQIEVRHERLCLAGRPVTIRRQRCGKITLLYRGERLHARELMRRPVTVAEKPVHGRSKVVRPGASHPWRNHGFVSGKRYWKEVEKEGKRLRKKSEGLAGALE